MGSQGVGHNWGTKHSTRASYYSKQAPSPLHIPLTPCVSRIRLLVAPLKADEAAPESAMEATGNTSQSQAWGCPAQQGTCLVCPWKRMVRLYDQSVSSAPSTAMGEVPGRTNGRKTWSPFEDSEGTSRLKWLHRQTPRGIIHIQGAGRWMWQRSGWGGWVGSIIFSLALNFLVILNHLSLNMLFLCLLSSLFFTFPLDNSCSCSSTSLLRDCLWFSWGLCDVFQYQQRLSLY